MADQPGTVTLKARWVFPVGNPPIANGCVTILGDRIVAVEPAAGGDADRDLAIVPGFVNAHTHLEFSGLAGPLGTPGTSLPAWVRLVVAQRRAATGPAWEAVRRGLQESLRAGTTAVGEIATSDWRSSAQVAGEPLPEVLMFHEAIGPTNDRVDAAIATADEFLMCASAVSNIRPALSPHAPYTVHPRLLEGLVDLGRRHGVPLAMHLAESREELELLRTGAGPMREMLVAAGAWDASADSRLPRVRDYLEQLAQAPRALVIHGNYLSQDEIEFVASRAETMSVVYCPRTHAFFGHAPYPLDAMLRSGASVALGTDSRASNPDLSLLAEMQFVARQHRQLSGATILELATLAPARALGFDDQMGSLEPGKLANLAVVRLGRGNANDPYARLLAADTRVVQTILRGQAVPSVIGGNS